MKKHHIVRTFVFTALLIPVLAGAQFWVPSGTGPCPTLYRTLSLGSSGSDVTSLQNFLIGEKLLGNGSATGYFGIETETAVKRWQSKNSVVTGGFAFTTGYGVVGPQTRAAIAARCTKPPAPVCPKYPTPTCTSSQYLQPGITGSNGCIGASSCVNIVGVLGASPVSGVAPLTVAFTASANAVFSGGVKIDFGDGSSATIIAPGGAKSGTISHAYANAGTYSAQLTGIGTGGSSLLMSTKTITVSAPPLKEGEVRASSFKNKADIAVELQAAINNPATKVITFDGASSTVYVSSGVRLRSDLKIIIGNGVTLRAKPGAFGAGRDILIRGDSVRNVTIEGGTGSRIVLNKPEYTVQVHALAFYNVENVTVRKLAISDSGGDGIYIGDNTKGVSSNKNILIDSVVLDNHARNALSVISIDGLVVKNSTFSNTKPDKTALDGPWDGIDFEPNLATQILKNIEVRDSVFYGNLGEAIDLHFTKIIDPANNTITIKMIRNRIYASEWGIKLLYIFGKPFTGKIEVNGLCSDRPTISRAVYGPTYAPAGTFTTSDIRLKCTSF